MELNADIKESAQKIQTLRRALLKWHRRPLCDDIQSIIAENVGDAEPPQGFKELRRDLRRARTEVGDLRKRWFWEHRDGDQLFELLQQTLEGEASLHHRSVSVSHLRRGASLSDIPPSMSLDRAARHSEGCNAIGIEEKRLSGTPESSSTVYPRLLGRTGSLTPSAFRPVLSCDGLAGGAGSQGPGQANATAFSGSDPFACYANIRRSLTEGSGPSSKSTSCDGERKSRTLDELVCEEASATASGGGTD